LLVSIDNHHSTNILKIQIEDKKIKDIAFIKFNSNINIYGSYDMNKDGLLDILYTDSFNNVNKKIYDII
jgi:hypothetical protein